MTPEEIQAAFIAQLEFNRQTQATQRRTEEQLSQFVLASEADRQASEQRSLILDAKLDRLSNITERFINASTAVIEAQDDRIREHQARIARQDALIERLDTIIERFIYREGRDNGEPLQ
ncbi:MAG: hypothetical protein KME35_06540 [Aphanocapsa sp. GSE-SYN-MK-11-07L]|jgi:response regulator RpfG family c-di-GMP phosphodiesterase|nr:hypothetical protein [Aphanocapsa sp. GSE-SYN-MK-11-07L]